MCSKCCDNKDIIFKEKENIEVLRILGLIKQKFHVDLIYMSDEKISQEFRFKKIDEQRSYSIEEINQNDLIVVWL